MKPNTLFMNFRLMFYWLVCTTVAVSASGYMVGRAEATEVLQSGLEAPILQAAIPFQIEGVPELGRAILLFFGIFAVAYTYQQAWVNFRSAPDSQKK